jgi:probable selenium-dependent hydroxylase accessory protein YqeC
MSDSECGMISLRHALMLEGEGVVSLVGAGGKTSLMFKLAHEICEAGESVMTTTTTKIYEPTRDQSSFLIVSDSVETIVNKAKDLLKNKKLHVTAAASHVHHENKLTGLQPESIDLLAKTNLFRWILVEADGAAGRPLKMPAGYEPVIPESTKWVIGMVGLNSVGKPLTDEWVHRPELFSAITGLAVKEKVTEAAIGDVLIHDKGIFKDASANALRLVFLNQADVPGGLAAGRAITHLLAKKKKTKLKRIIIGQMMTESPVLEYSDLNH